MQQGGVRAAVEKDEYAKHEGFFGNRKPGGQNKGRKKEFNRGVAQLVARLLWENAPSRIKQLNNRV
ncbi:MAG TPA: hypothetical protein DCP22_05185 [Ruminococcaceae bacterium]|nr:hypothetical protein [Oscillospiraceae bacterium]